MPATKKTTGTKAAPKTATKKTKTEAVKQEKTTAKAAPKKEAAAIENKFSGHYYYANGKRKTSIAKVRLYDKGKGEITVNGKSIEEYFYGDLPQMVKSPLVLTGNDKRFGVSIKVLGGGIVSQAGAARHGVAKALIVFDQELKSTLKSEGHVINLG